MTHEIDIFSHRNITQQKKCHTFMSKVNSKKLQIDNTQFIYVPIPLHCLDLKVNGGSVVSSGLLYGMLKKLKIQFDVKFRSVSAAETVQSWSTSFSPSFFWWMNLDPAESLSSRILALV